MPSLWLGLLTGQGCQPGGLEPPPPCRTTPWGYRGQSQKEPHVLTPKPPSAACLKAEPTWTEFLKLRDSHPASLEARVPCNPEEGTCLGNPAPGAMGLRRPPPTPPAAPSSSQGCRGGGGWPVGTTQAPGQGPPLSSENSVLLRKIKSCAGSGWGRGVRLGRPSGPGGGPGGSGRPDPSR